MKLYQTIILVIAMSMGSCLSMFGYNIAIWPGEDASVWAAPLNLTNVVAVSGGDGHAMALRADGTVVNWAGPNFSDMGVTNALQIASGWCHDLIVKSDGTVVDPGCTSTAPGNTAMPAGLSSVVAAAGGAEHSLVLKSDGTCVSWGWMTVSSGYVPAGLSNVTAIAAGWDVSAALMSDGTVVNWGYSGYGGTGGNGLTGIAAIAMGHSHGLALRTNGTVVTWGGTISAPPVTLTNVVKIGAKQQWACVLQQDGTLINWGYDAGQLNGPDQKLTNVLQLAPMNWAGMLLVGDGAPQPLWILTNRVAAAESTVAFKGEAVGTEPLFYQWYFNGTNLPGATVPTLTITSVQPGQAGSYFVVVSNAFGVRTNAGAQLTLVPAIITAQPTNQTVYGGDNVTISFGGEGNNLAYQWRFFGTNLDGATNAQLILPTVAANQAGDYSVVISNSYGSVESSNATLSVIPLAITSQPAGLSRYVGDSATFSVAAVKNGPFAYQWRFEGMDLPGKMSSALTLNNLTAGNAGNYSVVVTNPYGSLGSAPAFLNVVNSKPVITAQPAGRGAYPAGNTSFQVTADGSKPLFYQWLFNGTNIANATGSTLSLTNLNSTNAGNYTVLVSNAAGSTLSSNAALTFLVVVTWGQTNNYGLAALPLDLTNVLAVAAGVNHSVALKSNGRVVAWGYNFFGQTNVPSSASNVVAIAAAQDHTLALRSNGTVVAWGNGGIGVPAGLSNVIAVAAGDYHGLALKTNGTVVTWGDSNFANSTLTNVPANVTNVVAIAAGGSFSAALRANGSVVTWGSSPPSTNGMTNVVAIAASEFPLVALKADGKVVAVNVTAAPATLTNGVAVAAGRYHAMALKSNGTVTNWVAGNPVTPTNLTNVAVLASGQYHCLAIIGNGPQPGQIGFNNLKQISNSFSGSVPSQIGHVYWLEYKTNVTNAAWITLPLNAGNDAALTLTDSGATNATRFYRVRQW